jgi:hypothetical protein
MARLTFEETVQYAKDGGLCAEISAFRHICTRFKGHKGQHNGVRVEDTDENIYHAWGCCCD